MDMQREASDASISEGEGVKASQEALARQLQAVCIENQECEDIKVTLEDSTISDITCHQERLTMGSGESKCEVQTNGETVVNGASGDEAVVVGCPNTLSNGQCLEEGDDSHQVISLSKDSEETHAEVSELINEILHQSSYLEEKSVNGVEYTNTLPVELDEADADIVVSSSPHTLYFHHREENGSSPDSDSTMTTASEGSSTPTSELSATSLQSDTQNFIHSQSQDTTSFECTDPVIEPDCKTQEIVSNDLSTELILDTNVPDCTKEVESLSVEKDVLDTKSEEDLVVSGLGSDSIATDVIISEIESQKNGQEMESPESVDHLRPDPSLPDTTDEVIVKEEEIMLAEETGSKPDDNQQEVKNSVTDCQDQTSVEGDKDVSMANIAQDLEDLACEPDSSVKDACQQNQINNEDCFEAEVVNEQLTNTINGEDLANGTAENENAKKASPDQQIATEYVESNQAKEAAELQAETEEITTTEAIDRLAQQIEVANIDVLQAATALESLSLNAEPVENGVEQVDSEELVSSSTDIIQEIEQEGDYENKEENPEVKVQKEEEDAKENEQGQTVLTSSQKDEENSVHGCACKRTDNVEESTNVMVGVWAELRSSLRQLHRSMIPQSSQAPAQRSRPSINRIKALANMLVSHDAHQLYLRISHLAHELCIELKVRLLATLHDSPTAQEATAFVQGICDSYQWVMSVCEALHPALERLDSEHLSRFKLNWVTVNMHVFHSTILTDPDVHDYVEICKQKLQDAPGGEDVLNCLASLHRTLSVAEGVWVRADALLQDYAIERAALTARRRQLLADWEQFRAHHRNHHHDAPKAAQPTTQSSAASMGADGGAQCPCDDCVNGRGAGGEGQAGDARASPSEARPPASCECHFCNASLAATTTEEPVLPPPSSGSSLPPLAQPQLSLYPHIHNTPPGSDIVGSGQSREDLGPIPPAPTTKPPITTNPYLGSDLLTEQLMREWDLVYGDALTPPGSHPILPPSDAALPQYEGDSSSLVSGVEAMCISSSRPSYTHSMVDPSLPYVPDSRSTARAHTTILPSSSQPSSATSHTVSSAHQPKVPSSVRPTSAGCEGSLKTHGEAAAVTTAAKGCCSGGNTTSVITHTRAHHNHTTAAGHKGCGESETSCGDEWSSGDESDSSTTVSSSHQDPHCDCCYCHMLHHKQGGGRQKYSDRRERLLKILSRKKNARNNVVCTAATSAASTVPVAAAAAAAATAAPPPPVVPTSTEGNTTTPLGGQNIDEIMDYIEGNQTDEAKRAKKAAKKARQKQRKLVKKKEPEENHNPCENQNDYLEEDEVEDGPLAELRRRAPDVTITVVRPGQQTSRTPTSSQMAFQRPRDPSPPAMEVYKPPPAKLVPSLAQASLEPPQSSSRTILHPARPSAQGRPSQPQLGMPLGKQTAKLPPGATPNLGNQEAVVEKAVGGGRGGTGGLSSILKSMDSTGKDKEKDKGSQMVTIRRVMDPNSAEPTVTITLKGEQPEKDKVLFKLINGQAVAGNGGPGGPNAKKGKKNAAKKKTKAKSSEPAVPKGMEGLEPEEIKKLKKKNKKERQKIKKEHQVVKEQEKEKLQQLEIQKKQEFLRQQQEQIHQQQLALQRQQEELLKQQQEKIQQKKQPQTQTNTKTNNNKKNKKGKNATNSSNDNANKKSNKGSSNTNVSAVVYDGDNMAQSFNLPPGVTINKVAGQPGMVTISNNMGGAFSQPFLPNPNIYPMPVVQGFPVPEVTKTQLPKTYGNVPGPGLSWNSAANKDSSYPDEDNVIVVDTNTGDAESDTKKSKSPEPAKSPERELTGEEKLNLALKGLMDPAELNQTQKKKYRKKKKELREEEEKERLKQQEEDDLMDQMYHIARGNWSKISKDKAKETSQGNKKTQEQKENKKATQSSDKNNKQQNVQETPQQKQKQKQTQEVVKQNNKNNNKQGSKDSTLQNITNQPRKDAKVNRKEKNKQQEENREQKQKPAEQDKHSKQKNTQQQKHITQTQQKTSQKKQQNGRQNPSSQGKQTNGTGKYPNKAGYDPQDIAHEARYAQYLAANANTLAKMNYSAYNGNVAEHGKEHYVAGDEEKLLNKKRKMKKGKKGQLEDMTIDSVFTPKDVAEGELDETERDVEAFKRFCFNNVPRHSGEKPKVNFNVKDIMIKKRPCNGNL